MAKITYTNKETLNEQPSIAVKNKVTSDDMNEIKSVVNANDDNVGDLSNLNTTDKSTLVDAINEVNTKNANITGTILWTNPSPSGAFASQDITLSSSDYDFLEVIFNNQGYQKSVKVPKGSSILLDGDYYVNTSEIYYTFRRMYYTNDTKYGTSDGFLTRIQGTNNTFSNNAHCVPLYIIGYKTGLFS